MSKIFLYLFTHSGQLGGQKMPNDKSSNANTYSTDFDQNISTFYEEVETMEIKWESAGY